MLYYSLLLFSLLSVVSCKVFTRCELARELKKLGANGDDLNTWICIAHFESRYNTKAINTHTGDYGIFQISELFWCSKHSERKACNVSCNDLLGDDIAIDFKCAKRIYKEHQRLQGDGFKAWVVYENHCSNGKSEGYSDGCF